MSTTAAVEPEAGECAAEVAVATLINNHNLPIPTDIFITPIGNGRIVVEIIHADSTAAAEWHTALGVSVTRIDRGSYSHCRAVAQFGPVVLRIHHTEPNTPTGGTSQ